MPRTEQPLGDGDDPVVALARDLRKLRTTAGSPTYRDLASRTHYSVSTLADAASGKKLPTLAVTLAYVRGCDGDTAEWEQRWHSVTGEQAADRTTVEAALDDQQGPYAGLAAFQPDDADRFFGRETLVDDVVRRLAVQRFLAVFGASGAGKSSLLRAGLITAVRKSGTRHMPVLLMTPGRSPLEEFAVRLAALTGESPVSLRTEFAADAATVHLRVRQAVAEHGPDADLLVVVDQFEEVFTLCQDPREREQFIAALLHAAQAPTSRARVVLGVRTDFYTHCAGHSELAEALQDAQVLVGPMSAEQLRSAITQPAIDAGYRLETALVATIVAETTGRPGVLPLMSHALLETWRRRHGTTLTLAGYQATGGIAHAIARTAEHTYEQLDDAQQAIARDLFLRLTALGEGTEDTKRRVDHRELDAGPDTSLVVERLTQARLLTADRDGLEITHEALIRWWPRLHEWLSADREGLRVHRQLTEATDTWESLNRDPATLYRGIRLDQASTLASTSRAALTSREREFLAASVHARDDEQARARRRTRRLRQLVAAVVVFALLATTAAALAIQQRATAVRQRDDAVFQSVVAEADRLAESDPSLSAQLDLVAHRMRPADRALYTRLISTGQVPLATPLTGHTGEIYLTSFSPDGRTLATASDDKTVRLWDVHDLAHPVPLGLPLTGHTSWVGSAVFSPDGRTLATAGDDGTVRLWNVTDPAHPAPLGAPLTGHGGSVYLVAFSPDGHLLATANDDHTVRLWNVADPAHATPWGEPLTGHSAPVRSVAFSADGHLLAAGSDDSTVLLWDVADPAHPVPTGHPLTGHTGTVHSVEFSPDSHTLATGSSDKTIRLWNVTDPARPALLGLPLTGHTGPVWSVAFSPDGSRLATGSVDGTARLWNLADPADVTQLGPTLSGSGGTVYAVGFSPDGRTLATGGRDAVVRLWSLPAAVLIGHRTEVKSTVFSPNGHLIATEDADDTIGLWDATDPAFPAPLVRIPAPPGYARSCSDCGNLVRVSPDGRLLAAVRYDKIVELWNIADPRHPALLAPPLALDTRYGAALSFSPDGHTLATANDDNSIRLWDVADPAHPRSLGGLLPGHASYVESAAFSPDGHVLASASDDKTVQLWDVTDPAHPHPLGDPLTSPANALNVVTFSPDGHTLASAGAGRTVWLWDVTDPAHPRTLARPLVGHTESVTAAAFSPDGHTLATGSADHTIRLWDVTDPANPAPIGKPLTVPTGIGHALEFSPDAHWLAMGDEHNTVRLLDLDLDHAIRRICTTTRDLLTRQQWELHLSELPYQPPCGN